MNSTYLVLSVYCLLIVVASLLGGRLPSMVRLTHKRMQMLISFVGGLMLGIAVFHLLPHAITTLGVSEINRVSLFVMLGLLVMFFLLRIFQFHHHDMHHASHVPPPDCGDDSKVLHQLETELQHSAQQHSRPQSHSHGHHHPQTHHHGHDHDRDDVSCAHGGKKIVPGQVAGMDWLGVFLGLSLHTLIDGLALGASLQSDFSHQHSVWFLGLGTFLAILLHKPLDALSITALMQASNWPSKWQNLVNVGFAMTCPIGAFMFVAGAQFFVDQQSILIGSMLAFSAGVFLCISLSDLLPEMEFHSHHRVPLTATLLLGIGLAWGIHFMEPSTAHQLRQQKPAAIDIPEIPQWAQPKN